MALFKVFRGRKVNLPSSTTDGYAYFTTDDGKFYIDAAGQGENLATRTCINPDMTGATQSTAGTKGFVPAPTTADVNKFLKGNGTWGDAITQTTIAFGTCTTAGSQQVKVVTLTSDLQWQLTTGSIIGVKFSNNNSYSATAENTIKLNVNSTGNKAIYYAGNGTPTGTNTTVFGRANYVNYYMYDGTYWVWLSSSADNNNTYSNMSQAEATTGTATSARSISAKTLTDTILTKSKSLGMGTAVASGADLDTMMTIGNYYCSTVNAAKALTGTLPVAANQMQAFTMHIGYSTGTGYTYQEIRFYNSGVTWYRQNTTTSDTTKWQAWKQLTAYSFATVANITTGTDTTPMLVSPKVLHDAIAQMIAAAATTDTLLKV